ncbi:MAG: lytic transglycosylase [Proteobacteria bacterium]|nr:MAG: lytic transglycosylase [Pseudomonadota bacterium]
MYILLLFSKRFHTAFAATILAWGVLASPAIMADIYTYTDKDGTRWLTNLSVKGKKNVQLVARTPRRAKAAPSATRKKVKIPQGRVNSCLRLSHQQIEKRTTPYLQTIRTYASHYGVEENLVRAVIRQESCFNRHAQSHAGASGLMQLMPGTADMMGVDNIFDPRENIRGGVKYLSQMLAKFGGDKRLALAGYNAGPGAVIKYNGIPPYRETRDYVVKVIAEYKRLEKARRQANHYIRRSGNTFTQQ